MSQQLPSSDQVLVVIDLLEDYFDAQLWPNSSLPALRSQLAERANAVASVFRKSGRQVIWVRQEFEPDLVDAFPHMIRNDRAYTIRDTPGCQLLSELRVYESDRVLVKKRFSAFFGTELNSILIAMGAKDVYLAGITSSWCVRATATDAYQLGYNVHLVSDCMAGFDTAAHETSLSEMDGYIATCCRVDRIELAGDPS